MAPASDIVAPEEALRLESLIWSPEMTVEPPLMVRVPSVIPLLPAKARFPPFIRMEPDPRFSSPVAPPPPTKPNVITKSASTAVPGLIVGMVVPEPSELLFQLAS